MGKYGIFKVVTHIGGARHKRVQMCSQPGFWNFNKEWGTGITHTCWSCGGRVRGQRIHHSLGVISLVSVYAPTEASDLTVKDAFYAILESEVDQCPR